MLALNISIRMYADMNAHSLLEKSKTACKIIDSRTLDTYFSSTLSNNRFFLYQYAIVLYDAREYSKALKAIIAYENVCAGYNASLLKGDVYTELHAYKMAEKSYVRAKNMCPSRFLPLFKLFLLYQQSGQFSNASKIANIIVSK